MKPNQYTVRAYNDENDTVPFVDSQLYLMGDESSAKLQQRYLVLNEVRKREDYGVRLVLTWANSYNKEQKTRDLDLFVDFEIDK